MSVGSAEHATTIPAWIDVPPVFIVGAPRSGTTLMRLMLTAHPRVSIASEGAYVYLPALLSRRDPRDTAGLESLFLEILPHLEKEQFLSPPAFGDLLDWVMRYGSDVRSILTFYGTWEARILGKADLSWWGDNAPYHVHHIPFFDATFPGCKFIVMIRDPRDACASSKASFAWHHLDAAIASWELAVLNGLMGELYLGSARVKRLKYESLIRTPTEQLQDVCAFLDVEYTDHMLAYHESHAAKAIGRLSHHKNVLSSVFAGSIGKYRERLTPDEIATIEERLGTSMVGLGYMSYKEYAGTRAVR
jgi:Sulfotransferase family